MLMEYIVVLWENQSNCGNPMKCEYIVIQGCHKPGEPGKWYFFGVKTLLKPGKW